MSAFLVVAHATGAHAPGWLDDPALIACAVAAAGYALGHRRIRSRSPRSPVVARGPTASFWAGWALLVISVSPPFDEIADDLMSVHMVQHLSIGLVAPLLIVIGRPLQVTSAALPPSVRRRVVRTGHRLSAVGDLRRRPLWLAAVIVTAEVATWVVWHVPAAYDAAVRDEVLHAVEHLAMFGTGCALWWLVVTTGWFERSGLAVLHLFFVGLAMGAIAALMTLAPHTLYRSQILTAQARGIEPLADQQIAGAVMWVPGGTVLLVAAVVLFVRWLGSGPVAGEQPVLREA